MYAYREQYIDFLRNVHDGMVSREHLPRLYKMEATATSCQKARKATAMLVLKMFGVEAMLTKTYKKVPGKLQLDSKITESIIGTLPINVFKLNESYNLGEKKVVGTQSSLLVTLRGIG